MTVSGTVLGYKVMLVVDPGDGSEAWVDAEDVQEALGDAPLPQPGDRVEISKDSVIVSEAAS